MRKFLVMCGVTAVAVMPMAASATTDDSQFRDLEKVEQCIATYGVTFSRDVYDRLDLVCRSVAFPPAPWVVGLRVNGYPEVVIPRDASWNFNFALTAELTKQCVRNSKANSVCSKLLQKAH